MPILTRRRLLVAVPLVVLLLAVGAVLLARGRDLKSRSADIAAGTPRDEVVDRLGPPVLVMKRWGGKGTLLAWVDPLGQVNSRLAPDARTESGECGPSDSLYRRTVGRLISLP